MACRFPRRADTPDQFWQDLRSKVDHVEKIPQERFEIQAFSELDPSSNFAEVGCFIDDIFRFDAAFFGLSPREAIDIDPQQRILLELAWLCMEDAAVTPEELAKLETGVYTGVINHDYERLLLSDQSSISAYTGLGRSTSIAANRISYCFNFSGPSITIDTACSSSLTAVDSACKALAAGEIDVGFAGGANAILSPESYIEFSQAAMLTESGKCHAFDAKADGFVRAEGAGLILVKRLTDALADDDRIHATILATTVNQDGKTSGIMAPSVQAQTKMILNCMESCGITADQIGYVEAHGTGTRLGDYVEATSVGKAYGRSAKSGILPVGSVKTNIGHTEAAAGIAGLIKTVLAIKNQEIPPNLNFLEPNPEIDFENLRIRVPVEVEPWLALDGNPRIAAVNSFGFGGANAHAILREAPKHRFNHSTYPDQTLVLPLAAPTSSALDKLKKTVHQMTSHNPQKLESICHTLVRKPKFKVRQASVALNNQILHSSTVTEFIRSFTSKKDQSSDLKIPVTFVFNGIGTSWAPNKNSLYSTKPVFRSTIDLCDAHFRSISPTFGVRSFFTGKSRIKEPSVERSHAVHFALQAGLFELWKSLGVQPKAVVGHSVGEIAAAYAAGSVDLRSAVKIVAARATALQKECGSGLMLAAAISAQEAKEYIDSASDRLFIAAINSDSSVTFSGTPAEIQSITEHFEKNRIFCRQLELPVPFHSPLIDHCQGEIIAALDNKPLKPNEIHWYSSLLGTEMQNQKSNESYWWENFRSTVRFSDAINACLDDGYRVFVEIGPHPYLRVSLNECLQKKSLDGHVSWSLEKNKNNDLTLHSALAAMFNLGHDVNWKRINPKSTICDLPATVFDRKLYRKSIRKPQTSAIPDLNLALVNPASRNEYENRNRQTWSIPLKVNDWPWLGKHRLYGVVIFPAAGYIEAVLEAAKYTLRVNSHEINAIEFSRIFQLNPSQEGILETLNLELASNAEVNAMQFQFLDASADSIYCQGRVRALTASSPKIFLHNHSKETSSLELNYKKQFLFNLPGFESDDSTWIIRNADLLRQSEAKIELEKLNCQPTDLNYCLDPGLLDTCFRAASLFTEDLIPYLPVKIKKIEFWNEPRQQAVCFIKKIESSENALTISMIIVDLQGNVCARISELVLQSFTSNRTNQFAENSEPKVFQPNWVRYKSRLNLETNTYRNRLTEFVRSRAKAYHRRLYYETIADDLASITISYIGQCLLELGFNTSSCKSITYRDLLQRCSVDDQQKSLFRSCLDLLQHHSFLQITDDMTGESSQLDFIRDIPSDVQESVSNFLRRTETAEYLHEILLINRCGLNLSKVISGQMTGLESLFPNGSMTTLRNFYTSSPTCRIYNETLCESIDLILQRWGDDKPCQILEVGSGTGALLSDLLPILSKFRVRYTFSDISQSFIRQAKARFRSYDFIQYQQFDIDSDPFVQGFAQHEYDLILASDTLHLARDLDLALQNLNWLLQPNGYLHLIELTNEPAWARIVFGMLGDWWHKSGKSELNDSPSRPAGEWRSTLSNNGFECLISLGDSAESVESLHTVLVAQKSAEPIQLPSLKPKTDRNLLIFCDNSPFADRFLEQFSENSIITVRAGRQFAHTCGTYVVRPNSKQDHLRLVEMLQRRKSLPTEVIYLWNFNDFNFLTESGNICSPNSSPTVTIACFIQAMHQYLNELDKITIVTSNAHKFLNQVSLSGCLQATLWGVGRTIENEFSNIHCRMIDIDSSEPNSAVHLHEVIHSDIKVREIVLRKAQVYTSSISPVHGPDTEYERSFANQLICTQPGDLDSLSYSPITVPVPKENQAVIQVTATSLNFRDVMIALGALPDNMFTQGFMQKSLGIECTGRVVSAGPKVKKFKAGDHVIALAKDCFASHVAADENFVALIPDSLRDEAVVGMPTAYITALICLDRITGIRSGDSILIHCASGGVGLALVHLAQARNLQIFATAGAKEKRKFLNLLGVQYTSDSRSQSYAKDILNWTNKKGVDVVVNTVSGEIAAANSAVLKPGGLLIELGKNEDRDSVHTFIKEKNPKAKIEIVDIDQLWKENPKAVSDYFRRLNQLIADESVPVLPYQIFSSANVTAAFRHLASARHIGKVVVSMQQSGAPEVETEIRIDSEGSYIVAGGSRGFGFATVKWLCEQGARFVIVISRSPSLSDQFEKFAGEMHRLGIQIRHVAADIAHLQELQKNSESAVKEFPVIRGVIHCASDIDDHMIATLTEQSDRRTSAAKILGAWNLYQMTAQRKLDFFLLYSSVASLLGPSGQASYSAANSFLDSFSDFLRDQNVPAFSVNWGAVSDYGFVAENPKKSIETINSFGVVPLPAKSMLASLSAALASNSKRSRIIISGMRGAGKIWNSEKTAELPTPAEDQQAHPNPPSPKEKSFDLQSTVTACIARVFSMQEDEIDSSEPLIHYGMDSLLAVELSHLLKTHCSLQVAAVDLLEPISIDDIVQRQNQPVC